MNMNSYVPCIWNIVLLNHWWICRGKHIEASLIHWQNYFVITSFNVYLQCKLRLVEFHVHVVDHKFLFSFTYPQILKILLRLFKITFNPSITRSFSWRRFNPKHMTRDLNSFQSTPFKICYYICIKIKFIHCGYLSSKYNGISLILY
jgi:hypothetical protein